MGQASWQQNLSLNSNRWIFVQLVGANGIIFIQLQKINSYKIAICGFGNLYQMWIFLLQGRAACLMIPNLFFN